MEPKREMTSVDLAAVCEELQAITGAHFDKAYAYPSGDLFRFKCRHYDHGRIELLCEVGDIKRFHRADPELLPATPDRPPNFAKMLRNRLEHGTLERIEQVGFDRIVRLGFDVPDGDVEVIAELFGDGNLVVVGTDGDIVDCLREVRLQSRTVRPGGQYTPPTQRVNPLSLDLAAFRSHIRQSDTDIVRTLATQLNFGGRYAEELCTRAGVEKTLDIDDIDDTAIDELHAALLQMANSIREGQFEPVVYRDDRGVFDASPLAMLEHEQYDRTDHATVSSAFDAYFTELPERAKSDTDADDGDDERARLERILAQQEQAIEGYADQAAAYRKQAEALYAKYDMVDELIRTVRSALEADHGWSEVESTLTEAAEAGNEAAAVVESVDPEAGTLELALDEHVVTVEVDEDLEHNADRLYREAKAIEEKREGAIEALEDTKAELAALETDPAEPPTPESSDDVPWTERSSIPVRRPEHWYEQFRWFFTSDDVLVIGGRTAKQNEELINKYTEPTDRVMHSQAHGGPVTVIKASMPDEPSREVEFSSTTLAEAAQFAVSYSSVWKDGRFSGDVYLVRPDQMTKTAESGEYLSTGAFAVRGDREYFRNTPVGLSIGIMCEPETRVIGGPSDPIEDQAAAAVTIEPGRYAASDTAKRLYRHFRDQFADEGFVRRIASPDQLQEFLPPGGSRIID